MYSNNLEGLADLTEPNRAGRTDKPDRTRKNWQMCEAWQNYIELAELGRPVILSSRESVTLEDLSEQSGADRIGRSNRVGKMVTSVRTKLS